MRKTIQICDCSSTWLGDLKKHMLIHRGEKPKKCDLCDYSSAQSGHLENHMFTRTGEKS